MKELVRVLHGRIFSKLIYPTNSLIPISRSKSGHSHPSLGDAFAEIIHQTKTKKADSILNTPNPTYPSRYTYTGAISGPNYVKAHQFSDDKYIRTKTDSQPYKNHCLLFGYCGTKYIGNQRQPWCTANNTIEEELLRALLKSKWITEDAYWKPWKINMKRASRTDRGVSAARQCISFFMSPKSQSDIVTLNANLPEDIRIFSVKVVGKIFDPRLVADARTYSYTLPTIAFCHYNDQTRLKEFRLSTDRLKLVNETLQQYKGMKNYHNFTKNKEHYEVNSSRTMYQLECGEPFVRDDIEFAVIRIKGQSFMMHQIRKMIGLMLAVVRDVIDASVFARAFSEHTLDIPTAPGLGLVLDQIHYDIYNQRKDDSKTIDWPKCEDEVNDFREKFIHPIIIQNEIDEEQMFKWVETLLIHSYQVVLDTPRGLLPYCADDSSDEAMAEK